MTCLGKNYPSTIVCVGVSLSESLIYQFDANMFPVILWQWLFSTCTRLPAVKHGGDSIMLSHPAKAHKNNFSKDAGPKQVLQNIVSFGGEIYLLSEHS